VRDEIYNELKSIRSDEWLRGVDREAQVRILRPEFAPPAPPPAKQ
jgi:hypothetical protein